jgi:glucoamylase
VRRFDRSLIAALAAASATTTLALTRANPTPSSRVDDLEGTPLLFARRNGSALALACSAAWVKRSVGYVGSSNGWQDLMAHKKMT